MDGHAEYFGVVRDDLADPDWWCDPKTGRRAPSGYAFDVPYRNEDAVGDIKQIWEPSRHQYLTVLAAAYAVTGDERYAERVADAPAVVVGGQPAAARRALDQRHRAGHPAAVLGVGPPAARRLAGRGRAVRGQPGGADTRSGTTSAGWPPSPAGGRRRTTTSSPRPPGSSPRPARSRGSPPSAALAGRRAALAGAAAARPTPSAPASTASWPPSTTAWCWSSAWPRVAEARRRRRAGPRVDPAGAAADDRRARGRRGQTGCGRRARATRTTGTVWSWTARAPTAGPRCWPPATPLFGRLRRGGRRSPAPMCARRCWPRSSGRTRQAAPHRRDPPGTPAGPLRRRGHDDPARSGGEIWCRCDGGPHGFLSIAAHAHADALSVEVRHDGVDVLADPGTYCYHGQPEWRQYFRSTLGHNTLQLDGGDQSVSGGPFLWTRHARSRSWPRTLGARRGRPAGAPSTTVTRAPCTAAGGADGREPGAAGGRRGARPAPGRAPGVPPRPGDRRGPGGATAQCSPGPGTARTAPRRSTCPAAVLAGASRRDRPAAGLVLRRLRAQGTHHHAGRHRLRRRRRGVHHRAQVPRLGGRVGIKSRHWALAAAPLALALLAPTGCESTPGARAEAERRAVHIRRPRPRPWPGCAPSPRPGRRRRRRAR